ncbi:MAG: phosphoadenosine phosphosulfate reductase [Bacteroidetes bacterium GWF2_43_63]|nr:MAG: phosphoadenosine phosphosulfate reductase [Bacteroidetes bacterium GWE2_42_42]OFY56354.1 MAG: phosphoadenosine phosphosulfate reductase [Bacteroidetes bacterium GWF2_43_63]HBG69684.1 phosphoadenosine phosphosulfate reductase [Bacteroidales bacterium]HCB61951.1 phosphoadenosine phosphosulfate reductase [Bacteroidales bacterium]HCY42270.1 phosphoadenosine phosphosulfate reductase [Prolixibacteraceae bacterium]
MKNIRHVLGISGGKDSAALAIYMKDKYPSLNIEYYTCDTGKELDETYELIRNLEIYLGKSIIKLQAAEGSNEAPFDHHLKMYGGYLPSSTSRWCTKKLKLEPFEKFVGSDPVISYVGIRGDEDREGYISRKPNIQSIFPFRRNIWSEDVIRKILANDNISKTVRIFKKITLSPNADRLLEIIKIPLTQNFTQLQKLNLLLETGVKEFNQIVFEYLKSTTYPLSNEVSFELIPNEDNLNRDDIFKILEESGVGVPSYYKKVDFEINDEVGQYSRSRSGCFFCFFQQKIEWVWLYEQHPDLFQKAMEYEKDGYSWNQEETLKDLINPDRIKKIKEDCFKRNLKVAKSKSPFLIDILNEDEGCASCFI